MVGKHRAQPSRRAWGVVKRVGWWLPAAAGAVIGGWLIFAAITGAEIVMLKTGSMSPTMPAGSAAIAFPVSPSEVQVGDVVTVRRGKNGLPVTHRVVQLGNVEGPTRTMVLRGDANAVPDARPYQVTEALKVVTPVPGLGPTVTALRTPPVIASLTVIAATMVLVSFWPAPARARSSGRPDGSAWCQATDRARL